MIPFRSIHRLVSSGESVVLLIVRPYLVLLASQHIHFVALCFLVE